MPKLNRINYFTTRTNYDNCQESPIEVQNIYQNHILGASWVNVSVGKICVQH